MQYHFMDYWAYWPEAFGNDLDFVGYNKALSLLRTAAKDVASKERLIHLNKFRFTCNIPWHHDPRELKSAGLPVVAYTMFESTRMPGEWSRYLNKHVAAILVPSQWCADMFRLSGVKKPIKVVSLGVDPAKHPYIPPQPHEGFNFLWMGHNYDPYGRKGAAVAEQAFRELRDSGEIGPEAKLILKYRPHSNDIAKDNLEAEPGIIHMAGTFSEARMRHMIATTDCCINPSRGEGFGLIPLEQMASGRPVILTNWSYPYIDARYCLPVKYDLQKSHTVWCYKHLAAGGWGFEYNFGRGIHYLHKPRLLQELANGSYEGGPRGETFVPRSIGATLWNAICSAQKRLGLYYRATDRSRIELRLESCGLDATVDIADLKAKMLEVYRNRDYWSAIGRRASEFAHREWGVDRIQKELVQALYELHEEGAV
jgi:hypothetical protein